MENASKALLISGGVFLAIVILVIAVQLFVGYRDVAETYDETMTMSEISNINKEFTKYLGREDIRIQEVVTAARTAQNYNEKYGYKIITVLLGGEDLTSDDKENSYFAKKIKDNINKKYKINTNTIEYYNEEENINEGLVKIIKFTEVTP